MYIVGNAAIKESFGFVAHHLYYNYSIEYELVFTLFICNREPIGDITYTKDEYKRIIQDLTGISLNCDINIMVKKSVYGCFIIVDNDFYSNYKKKIDDYENVIILTGNKDAYKLFHNTVKISGTMGGVMQLHVEAFLFGKDYSLINPDIDEHSYVVYPERYKDVLSM